ncbi:MAG TPA: hypothetical protein VGM59_11905, partial [Dongiaceae bacterium]
TDTNEFKIVAVTSPNSIELSSLRNEGAFLFSVVVASPETSSVASEILFRRFGLRLTTEISLLSR